VASCNFFGKITVDNGKLWACTSLVVAAVVVHLFVIIDSFCISMSSGKREGKARVDLILIFVVSLATYSCAVHSH
jgi:hypothetical protein